MTNHEKTEEKKEKQIQENQENTLHLAPSTKQLVPNTYHLPGEGWGRPAGRQTDGYWGI